MSSERAMHYFVTLNAGVTLRLTAFVMMLLFMFATGPFEEPQVLPRPSSKPESPTHSLHSTTAKGWVTRMYSRASVLSSLPSAVVHMCSYKVASCSGGLCDLKWVWKAPPHKLTPLCCADLYMQDCRPPAAKHTAAINMHANTLVIRLHTNMCIYDRTSVVFILLS